jgi:DNA polymerase elongation subunit (family B)
MNHYGEYKHRFGDEIAQAIYQKSQELINNEFNTIADKNKYIRQIDLFKIWHYDNKARRTSLKDLEVCMHMKNVEEMPIRHDTWCKQGDEELVLSYNKNDVEATYLFFKTTLGQTDYSLYAGKNKLELRSKLQKKFNVNCLNLSDVGMGEQLMLNLYSRAVGKNPFDIKKLRTNRTSIKLKDCIPSWANIKSDPFKQFINEISNIELSVPVERGSFEFHVRTHEFQWDFGLGGSHGCCNPGVYLSDNQRVIVDFDISSLYPSIAKSLNLYPEHLGLEFIKLYSQFIDERITEKHKPKKERDNVLIEGYKLILNGIFVILMSKLHKF